VSRKSTFHVCAALSLASFLPRQVLGATGEGHVVELPPFIVTDSGPPLEWRYGEIPGFEVLSLCSDSGTREFIRQFTFAHQLLQAVLPPDLQVSLSLPVTHILCDQSMRRRLDQDVPAEIYGGAAPGQSPLTGQPGNESATRFRVLPNIRLQDEDETTIFSLISESDLDRSQIVLTPESILFALQRRTPPLPSWFIRGFLELYGSMSFEAGDARSPAAIAIAPLVWLSPGETKALAGHPAVLLPMAELLAGPRPPKESPEAVERYQREWVCQAALFERWALGDANSGRRRALWKFADRSSRERATEATFFECFGLSYAQANAQLALYLPRATAWPARVESDEAPQDPDIRLRPATDAEIARIKGDWERLETAFVKRTYPALSGEYLEQTRKTMRRAYDGGDRDPRLLATMGLCECDAGEDAAALPLLIAAAQAHVVRPRAYYELARIIYAREGAKPAGPRGKMSAVQTGAVLAPIREAQREAAPLVQTSVLFADIWFHTEAVPSPTDLAELGRDTQLFPKNLDLGYRAAILDLQAHLVTQARELIQRGLDEAPDPATKARFAKLDRLLASQPP